MDEEHHYGTHLWSILATSSLSMLIPIGLPAFHMLIFDNIWGDWKQAMNRTGCNCSCNDAVFQGAGQYWNGKYPTEYKHVYFNSTSNTFKMWTLTVIFTLFMYSSFQRFFTLLISKLMRWSMGILFLCNLHNQYFAWWVTWNYLNDDFYDMWDRQWFFTVTEGISLGIGILHMDRSREVRPYLMLIISVFSLSHVFISASDQFIENVIYGYGDFDQIFRDILLMASDLLVCGLSLYELCTYALHKKGISLMRFLLQPPIVVFTFTLFLSLTVVSNLCLQVDVEFYDN